MPVSPISSKATFFCKRVFPCLWFGGLLFFVAFGLLSQSRESPASNIPFLIVPVEPTANINLSRAYLCARK